MSRNIQLSLLILLMANLIYAQTYVTKDDDISILLNPSKESSLVLSNYIHNALWFNSLRKDDESVFESIECLDSTSISSLTGIKIFLKSGTSWEYTNPPRQPFLFVIRLMLKSKNQKVINHFNYVEFLGTWEARNELPYEMIEKFIVNRDIVTGDGHNCVLMEYEIVPQSTGILNIVRREIK